jgi:predicted small metal-binding protein
MNMDKIISCKDFMSECTFTACARTEAELFEKILEHGRTVHRRKDFSPDIYGQVRASIKEGYCDLEDQLCKYGECCWEDERGSLPNL